MSNEETRKRDFVSGYTATACERSPSGEIIEDRRIDKDLSINAVSKMARLSAGTVCNVERYGVVNTKVGTLLAICKVLELDPMELIKADVGQIL